MLRRVKQAIPARYIPNGLSLANINCQLLTTDKTH